MESESCQTFLLSDDPARKDDFGSHKTVASAVADMILREKGGRAIALTGAWGSGKSTNIELLKDELRDRVEIFVFNAWSHQGDPLRRSFLEQLIDFLIDHDLLTEKNAWRQKRDELSHRKREQETESTPILKTHAKIIGASLLLTPFGIAAFSRLGESKVPTWLPKLGALVALAPFAIFLGMVVVYFLLLGLRSLFEWQSKMPNWLDWLGSKWPKPLELFQISVSHSITKTKSLTFETDDPTSIEFQKCFDLALKDALAGGKKKLAIIVDNLDRMDPELALSLWATMGTFFDFRADSGWLRSLWLIVPFDPAALSRLFPKSLENQVGSATSSEEGLNEKYEDLSRIFVDKTFATSFHIPPPVASDWQEFLIKCLKEALPGHAERTEELHSVYRIYYRANLTENRSPTPRDIKIFVNKLGAIHRQHADSIPLSLQALYVVLARETFDLPATLRMTDDEKPLGQIPIELVGEDWRSALAAIYYNTEPEHALQLLLRRRLETALLSNNSEELAKLRSYHGITQVVEEIVESNWRDWATSETSSLAMVAASLRELELAEDSSIRRSWKLLCDAASAVKSWSSVDAGTSSGIVQLLIKQDTETFAKTILGSLAKSNIAEDKGDAPVDAALIQTWLLGITEILSKVTAQHPVALESFSVQATPPTYISLMAEVFNSDSARSVVSFLRPSSPAQGMINQLEKYSLDNKFDSKCETAVASMLKVNTAWDWENLVEQITTRLNGSNTLGAEEVRHLVRTLLKLAEPAPKAQQALDVLAEQGHIAHHIQSCSAASDNVGVALCVLPILLKIPLGTPTQDIGNSAEGTQIYTQLLATPSAHPEVIRELGSLVMEFGETSSILDLAKKKQTKALAESILQLIASGTQAYSEISAANIIDDFETLKNACDAATFEELIQKSTREASLKDTILQGAFDYEMAELYEIVLRAGDVDSQFSKFLRQGLSNISEAIWLSELSSEGPLIELAIGLVARNESPKLSIALQDALLAHAKELLSGEANVQRLRDQWSALPEALTDSSQDTLFRTMSDDLLCQYENGPTDAVLDLYGERLSTDSVLSHNSENLVLHAFRNFLSRDSLVELSWLNAAISKKTNLLPTVNPSTKQDFENRVVKAYRESKENEGLRAAIGAIARNAAIPLTDEEPSQEETEQPDPKGADSTAQ
jgi:hypothetical protein